MKRILLIMIGVSMLLYSEFSRDGNGLVTDSVTGLVWQDDYRANDGSVKEATWVEAISYCEALTLGGNDDWRLSNKKELLSIVDYATVSPSISSVFQNTSGYYWSSTTDASDTSDAWHVNFDYGYTYNSYKSNNFNVRCVRAGQ